MKNKYIFRSVLLRRNIDINYVKYKHVYHIFLLAGSKAGILPVALIVGSEMYNF